MTALITPDFKHTRRGHSRWAVHYWNKKLQWESSSLDLTKKEALKESRKWRAKLRSKICIK